MSAAGGLLGWDQNTYMPAGGAEARAEQLATLEGIVHARLTEPEHERLIAAVEPYAASLDPDDDVAALLRQARRDHDKAARVPAALATDMAREAGRGFTAWTAAREAGDFGRFRDSLERQVDLRRRYAACFAEADHPYDVLLDDFEPGMTTAQARPLFEALLPPLAELVAAVADSAGTRPMRGVMEGDFPVADQRAFLPRVLAPVGFDPQTFRLDTALHPFAAAVGAGDVRLTTRYDDGDLAFALYSALHELGHGLYEAGFAPSLRRTPLHDATSLGVHESQSRLWENLVGRSRPFLTWLLPLLRDAFPGRFDGTDVDGLYRDVNAVLRTPVRIEADETTYNLHVGLRFELELALLEGELEVDGLPAAWNAGMVRLLGVEPPDDVRGVLQDVHWSQGLFGYFPTYTFGNLMAAQLWERIGTDLPALDAQMAAGDFGPLRDWLGEHVHRHGRKLAPRELLARATGGDLSVEPLLEHLRGRLTDAGLRA